MSREQRVLLPNVGQDLSARIAKQQYDKLLRAERLVPCGWELIDASTKGIGNVSKKITPEFAVEFLDRRIALSEERRPRCHQTRNHDILSSHAQRQVERRQQTLKRLPDTDATS